MNDYEKLSHTMWECKYHVVFIPKYRKGSLFGTLKKELGMIFHRLAGQKESKIEEGHVMADHVHMMLSIPPKLAVSHVVGYIKGKSAIAHRENVRGQTAQLRGAPLLGARIFRFIRRSRRNDHS